MKKLASKLAKVRSRARDRRLEKKRARGLCDTPHCRRIAREGRHKCNTCRSRLYDDPAKLKLWNLRKSAKRRGIAFALTWDWLRRNFPEYLRAFRELHIDRKDRRKGYVPGNVQLLDASEHGSKSWAESHGWTWDGGMPVTGGGQ